MLTLTSLPMTLIPLMTIFITGSLCILAWQRLADRGVGHLALVLAAATSLGGCAYNIGTRDRQIPGGYRLVSVPVFKNSTQDVNSEVYFTNAFIREMQRSKLGKVVDKRDAEVQILGTVESIKYVTNNSRVIPDSPPNTGANGSPQNQAASGAVQNTEYRVFVVTALKLQRISDERILWEGKFSGEHSYLSPTITILGINSADALYNQSAREQTIKGMADDIMVEAFERMTENF